MSEAKHTPGEWFWSGNSLMANRDDHSEFVMDVDGASVADKALIAAAPNMLAVLKDALDLSDRTLERFLLGRSAEAQRVYDMCVAAIAKAEGQS